MGKATRFGYMEIDLVADILDYYATNGERLLAAQAIPGEPGEPGVTLLSEPVGVTGYRRELRKKDTEKSLNKYHVASLRG